LDDAFRKIPINYGNQPSIETAFVFNHIGKPWLTQYWAREVVKTVFGDLSPKLGYSGDEDQGLMGSLSAIMKMGLFEMRSGADVIPKVDIGSPIFDKITIHLNRTYYEGSTIEIIASGNSDTSRYIKEAQWNGIKLKQLEMNHGDLTKGGVLKLEMGDTPNKEY
jgi:putative alpha-1,2-mannosidase